MSATAPHCRVTVADYLVGERDAEIRHEYIDGEVYAMTGASRRHVLIVTSMILALGAHARQRGCQVLTNDMKLRLEYASGTVFYYPDLMLACDPQDNADPYYLTRPCLIVEVLSPATERVDRREKFLAYQTLPSLMDYVLVAQDRRHIEIYRRRLGWAVEVCETGSFTLDCLDAELTVDAVYQDVSLSDNPGQPG